jgi:hypothetical protein
VPRCASPVCFPEPGAYAPGAQQLGRGSARLQKRPAKVVHFDRPTTKNSRFSARVPEVGVELANFIYLDFIATRKYAIRECQPCAPFFFLRNDWSLVVIIIRDLQDGGFLMRFLAKYNNPKTTVNAWLELTPAYSIERAMGAKLPTSLAR